MIRDILKMGDERLLRVAAPVPEHLIGSAELQQLIDDMFETMRHVGGVGLAAPQVGIDLQLVIFGFERSERYPDAEAVPQTILLNPVITPLSTEIEEGWEGCLSVPGLRGVVPRYKHISYEGIDPQGNPVNRVADGFHARVVQHECDHLIGRLILRGFRISPSSVTPRYCSLGWTPATTDHAPSPSAVCCVGSVPGVTPAFQATCSPGRTPDVGKRLRGPGGRTATLGHDLRPVLR